MESKLPLSEVERWDLEDLDAYCAMLDMRSDIKAASAAYQEKESEDAGRGAD